MLGQMVGGKYDMSLQGNPKGAIRTSDVGLLLDRLSEMGFRFPQSFRRVMLKHNLHISICQFKLEVVLFAGFYPFRQAAGRWRGVFCGN
jgi:hypothetical protein